jgi:radical SAM-linked protein
MVRDKVRIRFRKLGDLRLVSHHDLLRCFERMLRRAALPFHSTQGFNPKPRLVFAMPLSLGMIGHDELVELELDAELEPSDVHARLGRQAPPGLEILSVERISPRLTAHVQRALYRVAVPPARVADLPDRVAALLAAPECWFERQRPQPRRLDLRPYLADLRVRPDMLEVDLWVTPNGTARPEEVLEVLGLRDLLDAGAVIERVGLDLQEETLTPNPPATSGGSETA